jgi:DNA processing protein
LIKEELIHMMALSLVENVGPVNAKRLVAYCGSAEAVFKQKKSALELVPGVGEFIARSVLKSTPMNRVEQELKFIEKNNIQVFSYLDKEYPQRLKFAEDGPIVLYAKGKMDLNVPRVVSIVGTRKPTDYGKEFTEKLVKELVQCEVMVLSGLAYGIDITAHRSALQNDLQTVAVVAHGMDDVYPGTHRSVLEKMMHNGGMLSEYMSDTNPDKENFPSRNRIVAGMSDAIIVIETALKGGSFITANLGNDYNRDVFALPGRITDEYSVGCNRLIRSNRAALMESPKDFIEAMGWQSSKQKKNVQPQLFLDLDETEMKLINLIKSKGNSGIDLLSVESGITMSQLSALLLNLEFKGAVKSLPGKIYTLA